MGNNAGYIYVLINPSMEGLLKIGKTTRDPEGRAKELSAATGVPTPFYLAYKAYFHDCTKAEQYVHARLERMNYRLAANREFFRVPLEQTINTILEALQLDSQSQASTKLVSQEPDSLHASQNPSNESSTNTWEVLYAEAMAYDYGLDNTLEDKDEAMSLYKQAVKLGSPCALWRIGRIIRHSGGHFGDNQAALQCFKEGTRRGDDRCWAEMALIYFDENHFENEEKCWDRYFVSQFFKENLSYKEPEPDRKFYSIQYLDGMLSTSRQVKFRNESISIKTEMTAFCTELIEAHRDSRDHMWRYYQHVLEEINSL